MTVTDRARDIAVLMALGARRGQVTEIFVLQGLTVSIAGTAAGLMVGYGFAWMANLWHLIPLNPQVYAIDFVPFHANAWDVDLDRGGGPGHQHGGDNPSGAISGAHPSR